MKEVNINLDNDKLKKFYDEKITVYKISWTNVIKYEIQLHNVECVKELLDRSFHNQEYTILKVEMKRKHFCSKEEMKKIIGSHKLIYEN